MSYYFRFETMFRRFLGKSPNKTSTLQDQTSVSANKPTVGGLIILPPFRPINDFISKEGWNMPTFSEPARLKHRIINNLIYYQRNYFTLGIQLMLLIGYKTFISSQKRKR